MLRVLKSTLKWSLVALGAWCWIGVWFQRSIWLGLAQAGIIGTGLYYTVKEQQATRASAPATKP